MPALFRFLMLVCFVALAWPCDAQGTGRRSRAKKRPAKLIEARDTARRTTTIPEEATLHENFKKRKKVVIVPAPPPPPGPDPIPPKREP
jgi:hypothetical protein